MNASAIELEKQSSAITLSDMEVFIFPELMYSLVLANIMSPRIWQWRDDPWFEGLEKQKPYRRMTRLKQYIMDHYAFNLDLDTWGLTRSDTELARFRDIIDEQTLAQSNALFGYEGDRYYFDIDIRTHFGLDKYAGDVIPYWKTETVEAMDAFHHRPSYGAGAGECVSLATLYAAALFIVARIPLRDIYLMATPLHSQNFVDLNDGILTNNRRLVTKNMWFNGTALSAQARRALENERVTIVTHASGHIHTLYPEATIAPDVYDRFSRRLSEFLVTPLDKEILGNFLRQSPDIQRCFQIRWHRLGRDCYIRLDKAFRYENGSPYTITDKTREKLLAEVPDEDFECGALPQRILLNDLEDYIEAHRPRLDNAADLDGLRQLFKSDCLHADTALQNLIDFCYTRPRLPDVAAKIFTAQEPLALDPDMGRDAIIAHLEAMRDRHPVADLAFYAYRDLTRTPPAPYLKACLERNPVSIEALRERDTAAVIAAVSALEKASIYDGVGRLAQPDEVWNFGRGDGLERAILLADVLRARGIGPLALTIDADTATLSGPDGLAETFPTAKGLPPQTWALLFLRHPAERPVGTTGRTTQ